MAADSFAIMTLSEAIGDVVQIILRETGVLNKLGFTKQELFLKVVGLDEHGLWVAHPDYRVVRVNDEDGNPLPRKEQIHDQVQANFLINWELIGTIVHFPEREGFDFPHPLDRRIGFARTEDTPSPVPRET